MLSRLFGGTSCSLDITLNADEKRKFGFLDIDKRTDKAPIYSDNDDIEGIASIHVRPGKKLDHQGIKIEFVGRVEYLKDKQPHFEFFSIQNDLSTPSSIYQTTTYPFKFSNIEKKIESYKGESFSVRYLVRLIVQKNYGGDQKFEKDVIIQNVTNEPDIINEIRLEVGIEDFLHIEFIWNKSKYHLKDCIRGYVHFLLVRLKIKYMELDIVKRETIINNNSQSHDTTTISKFEIMDGNPQRGESIPVRMYLTPLNLTPSYLKVLNKLSVRYFLNLVLIDEDDRRYFKQQEIIFWRKKIG